MYGIDSVGLDGEVKKFEKPIFQTWLMFFAMVFALPIQWGYHWYVERKWRATARNGSTFIAFITSALAWLCIRKYALTCAPALSMILCVNEQ